MPSRASGSAGAVQHAHFVEKIAVGVTSLWNSASLAVRHAPLWSMLRARRGCRLCSLLLRSDRTRTSLCPLTAGDRFSRPQDDQLLRLEWRPLSLRAATPTPMRTQPLHLFGWSPLYSLVAWLLQACALAGTTAPSKVRRDMSPACFRCFVA